MHIREIDSLEIEKKVKDLFIELNYNIGTDIIIALKKALLAEEKPLSKYVLETLIKNSKIAKENKIPLCQDTGMAIVFAEYGESIVVKNGSFNKAIENGVRSAYIEGYLRKSIVSDPLFDRKNTKDNTPVIIYTDIVSGDKISILAGCKGFGSENMSAINMFNPSCSVDDIKEFIIKTVKNAGASACPPMIIGIGIGGTFEKAAQISKKATFRDITIRNGDLRFEKLEKELLHDINLLNIGPAGLGGKTTALAVNIETYPTHIAGLPVAINICCHACRHRKITI